MHHQTRGAASAPGHGSDGQAGQAVAGEHLPGRGGKLRALGWYIAESGHAVHRNDRYGNICSGTREVTVAVTVGLEPYDGHDAARLREAQRAELDDRYGNDNHEPGPPPTADDVPVFVVARTGDGVAVGCGGLRFLDPGLAEIKRMYVSPTHRGTGVATLILRDLEARAGQAGIRRLVLETGTLQPEAIRFYEREGYEHIENFGPYVGAPLSVCFARGINRG
jgi:GNAT superfamily N-acetyltransferase